MGATGGDDHQAAGRMFSVTVTEKEVVAAVLPMHEHWLPLSNLDLLLPPLDVGVFFCYKRPTSSTLTISSSSPATNSYNFRSMVGVLKKAMAQVLVSYYAFAGEVVANSVGEPELLCNNRGVDFFEAVADIELMDLNLYNPDDSIEGKLVPRKKDGVLAVQATQLKCGGLVVACTFDHRIADAYSANMFLVSWAETAQSKPISLLPSFRRSLLNPRRPSCVDASLDNMYVPVSTLSPPKEPAPDADQLVSRIYYVKADDLNQLQSLASSKGNRRTKMESFSGFLWQLVAKYCAIKDDDDDNISNACKKISKMGIVVDGRTRLSSDLERGDVMEAYFGNVLSIPYGSKTVRELIENPLSWVANEVHDFLENAVSKEHFLGLIDWVEARRPEPAVAKIYCGGGDNDGPALVVSSGQRFPVSKVDFGWGVPLFGSYHFPWGGTAGYVMPLPNPAGNGDWMVYMHLLRGQLEFIETEASNFLRPLTCNYLRYQTPSN
ncbi:PREDICTED: shikimate O-hydroxycinnamoyltransferase [Populus euphratica]|uniref:Shikimate O-hydroxycinnamoyltransferase n=1 Tax=Populus euphratica TaxID=75702 RepID=A0AAJ6ULA5_POPEU|nr:PREDICTED: shikimate O-hydroxycinnamoyltransferase [Populus euphratica]